MNAQKQCPSCGREVDAAYQFCPFDGASLTRKCPSCGRIWESSYKFCPLDSTSLTAKPAAEEPAPPSPTPHPPPPPEPPVEATPPPPPQAAEPPPAEVSPAAFTFEEQFTKPSWKTLLFRPATIIFALGTLVVVSFVWYMAWRTSTPDLPPPPVTYSVLPNEGKTKGVPVVIRVGQLAVLQIDDPMESGGAARAQQVTKALEGAVQKAKGEAGVRFAVDIVDGRPAILEVSENGSSNQSLVTATADDLAISSETDATRLASRWAERLTDAVKVYVLGQRPTFSTGTEFGDALLVMYRASLDSRGKVTRRMLDQAFRGLSPERRKALETPP